LRLDLDQGKMYWSDWTSNGVLRSDLDGQNVETVATDSTGFVVDVALDTANQFVYWSNPGTDTVRRVGLGGGEAQTVVGMAPFDVSYGLAVDAAGQKLYWTETGALGGGNIVRGNLDGTQPAAVVPDQIGSPLFVAVDDSAGWLYWTAGGDDVGMGKRFARAHLDGSAPETLIDGQTGNSLVLDLVGNRMLWTTLDAVKSANVDGSDIQTLFQTPGASAYALAIDNSVPGDANGDRLVNLDDFGLLKANFGSGSRRSQGDFNADHQVDLSDFGVLKQKFGSGGAAAVPEPATVLLALLAAAGAWLRRRLLSR
jgi:DNA-binding beta-propeller fold protein YncE